MENIKGKIEGKPATAKGVSSVVEIEPGHFIAASGTGTSEIFLTSPDLLSDGNALDGIEVKIESEREQVIRERFANSIPNGSTINDTKGMILKAPMPGMVKTISVAVGDNVQKNTQVLVLEAMKMENSIMAGVAGKVSKILVEAGMSVEKNMLLAEFLKE